MDNMEIDNRSIVGEEEVYAIPSTIVDGSSTYNELVSSGPSKTFIAGPIFKSEWQNFPEFQSWLRPIPEDTSKAWCRACDKMFKADLKSLRVHGVGKSHVRMVQSKFPDEVVVTTPSVAYNVITDRKGTYGIGIISKPDNSIPITGNTLYVNPTNPNTNVLTCDPKQEKDSFVVVSVPKDLDTNTSDNSTIQNDLKELHHLQFAEPPSQQQLAEQMSTNGITLGNQMIQKHIEECCVEDLVTTEDVEDVYDFTNGIEKTGNKPNVSHALIDNKQGVPANAPNSRNVGRAMISQPAPFWKSTAIINGHITELKSSDYIGRYLVLFFYPQAFSKLCPNEINALSDRIGEFHALNTEVIACSVDSHLVHQAWSRVGRPDGGIAFPKIVLLSDNTHSICKSYGCYMTDTGHTLRAHFIIDTTGIVRHITMNDIQVARNINEILRLIQAFQHTDEMETNCPVDWKPGDADIP